MLRAEITIFRDKSDPVHYDEWVLYEENEENN